MKTKTLKPIKETTDEYDRLEEKILKLFKQKIYLPLLHELGLGKSTVQNSRRDDLISALNSGKVTFHMGQFRGRFGARVSGELRRLGAKWDRRQGSFKVPFGSLPQELQSAIQSSEYRFNKMIAGLDKRLAQIVPAEVADHLEVSTIFDSTLFKVDSEFRQSVKKLALVPKLSKEARGQIAEGYNHDLQRFIKGWTEREVSKLRKEIQRRVFTGLRYESAVDMIKRSFGVSQNKAKFLARQETGLMIAQFKQARYQEAGVDEYIWGCVKGSPNHPVRPMHKALEGKRFKWNNPPVTDKMGNRNNPGQDYNCRCFARPVVKFK